jgi:outer membrane lipoprotein-sorting protein
LFKKERALPMIAFVRSACAAVLIMLAPAWAQEPAIMKTVRSLYNAKTSLETKFDLHIFWKVREKEETKSGRIFVAPGDKFRVELGRTVWVSNGTTYWQSEKDDGVQVTVKRLADVNVGMLPSHVLSTYVGDYSYRLKEEKGGKAVVEWSADSGAGQPEVARIRLSIEKKSGKITTLFVVDKSGNESTYTFTKTKFPAKVPDTAFEFTPPQGASILDMRN